MWPTKLHPDYSRRAVLRGAALLATGAPLMALQTRPHLSFPTEARQRLAVTSYPFRAYIESPTNPGRDKSKPGMDLKEFPAMIVKRFGVYNVNPLGDHLSSTDPAYLDSFREAVQSAGSHVVDLGLGDRDFSHGDKSKRDEAVAYGRKWIDIASVIGSPSVRQHLRTAPGMAPSVGNTVEGLGRLADYGSKKNIIINLENDSPGSEDPFFLVEVLGKANSPYLRALPDFGNSLRGHDAAYNQRAVDAMFKYAYNMCHVKDVLRPEGGEVYHVDVARLFSVARANSYRGYFSMEFDTAAGDPFEGTENLVMQSLRFMSAS
jgi:sugar phosphate isomerase/epimerase